MSKEIQAQLLSRNKPHLQNRNQRDESSRTASNSFKITSKLILDSNYPTLIHEEYSDNAQNSFQKMNSSSVTNKIKKMPDFVHLPRVQFDEAKNNQIRQTQSQSVITNSYYEPKHLNAQNTGGLFEQTKNSVILESEQKLSESQRQADQFIWNMEKLQMSLEYVDLEQPDSPVRQRKKTKRRRDKQMQKQLERQKQRVRRERERNMEMVSGFLSGKATFMWLFIIQKSIEPDQFQNLKKMYQAYSQSDYQIPICKGYNDAIKFLKIQSCFFKVVTDLENCQLLISEADLNKNVIALYLYNPQKERGVSRAFELKRKSRKIRGMFMSLTDAVNMAEEQIENEAKFIRVGQLMQRQRNRLRFPAFFILSGNDNTEVTSYRMCLYASLCIKQRKQRQVYLKQFTDMVELRYANNQKQLKNLAYYKQIDHFGEPDQSKHREIIQFYVKETFYYILINAILRLSRNTEEFRPCVIPFNQTYRAIKYIYQSDLKNNKKHHFTAYRGAKLRNSDVKSLKIGSLIQLLGFTSASRKRQEAEKFMDNDSYLIQIIVDSEEIDQKLIDYDHGFIDINKQKLAETAFQSEQQILFNALNVYRVIKIDLSAAVRKITLKYGAILDLIKAKNIHQLSEFSVLENYRHCVKSFKQIEDDGDALRLAQDHDQCASYYLSKIQGGDENAKILGKLAGAQLQLGDLDLAYQNAVKSLELIEKQVKKTQLNLDYQIPLLFNSTVFKQSEDIVNYERSTNLYLNLQISWDHRSQTLLQRAEKKLALGDYKGCLEDLRTNQVFMKDYKQSFDNRRNSLKRKYFLALLCCLCSTLSIKLQEQKQAELAKIEEDQIIFFYKKDLYREMLAKNQIAMSNLYLKIGDQIRYSQSLKKAQSLLSQINFYDKPQIQKAKLQVLKANSVDIKNHFQQYERYMEQVILKLKQEYPLHPDIAKYNEMLGLKRYERIQQYLNIPHDQNRQNSKNRYNYEQHKLMYKQCKHSLKEAAEQFAFLKGSSHNKTIAINCKIATLDYDFSLLKEAEEKTKIIIKAQGITTQSAKCHILLAKIALAKGELKRAYSQIEKATIILKNSIIKFQNPEYDKILLRHPLYIQISILRAKIYNRQQKHHLALKQLQMLQRLVKLQKPYNIALLANLQQEQAEILVSLGQTENFEGCILRSVQLREQAMGKYNIPNAISFSNLFKYLRYTKDFQNSVKYHQKSTEIFSRFPSDHPNTWILHLSNGLIFFQRKQFNMALPQLQMGLKIAEKRYSTNHINFMKIKLQFAKLIKGMGHLERALRILQNLEAIISKNIKESAIIQKIENQIDDQKIAVKKNILTQMKELYQRCKNDNNIIRTMLGIERCQVSLREWEQFISEGQKIDSLKSLT